MAREFELARTAARGTLHLLIGKIVSRAVGVIGGLVLIRLLKPEGYGLMVVAVVAPRIFRLFRGFGVNAAITKHFAEHREKGEVGNLKSFLYAGLGFSFFLSLGLTILCYFLSDVFATMVIGKPDAAPLIRVASLYVLAWTLYDLSQAAFLGLDATKAYVLLMLFFEIFGASLPVILVIYGMGVFGALLGLTIATLIAGSVGALTSILITTKKTQDTSRSFGFKKALKKMLSYGVPLMTSRFIANAVNNYYNFMIAVYCVNYEIGNYSAARKVNEIVYYLTVPISSVLLPTFSKVNPEKEPEVLRKVLAYSIKYSSLLILPAVLLIMVLAQPLIVLLLGVDFKDAWLYLTLIAIGPLGYGLGNIHLRGLLIAQGETTFIIKLEAISAAISVPLGLALIPSYGILGLILASLVVGWPSYIVALKKVHRKYGINPPFHDMWKLYTSIGITALILIPIAIAPINNLFKIAMGGLIGPTVFGIATLITRAIKVNDVNALREILAFQPLIGGIADKILAIMKRIASLMR